jgi:hypothetical protein
VTKTFCVSVAILCFILLGAGTARAEGLADRVPSDAVVYVGWEGADKLKGAYEGTHLKAVMDASSLPEFLEKKLPGLLEQAAGPEGEDVSRVIGTLGVLWRYPTVVYVGAMEIKAGAPPMPRVAVMCDAGDDAAAIEKQVKELVDKAGPAPLEVKREGTRVMLVIGKIGSEAENFLLGRADAPSSLKPLGGDKAFSAAQGQVKVKDVALTVYINVPGWVKMADDFSALVPEMGEMWPKIRDALNLKGIQSAVFTAGFDGKDWMTQAFIGMEGPRTGLLALLDGTPLGDEQLKVVPETATWMVAARFDLAKIWEQVETGVNKASPETGRELANAVNAANKAMGINLQKDLVATLGDDWVAYAAPTVGGNGIMGLTVVNTPRDAAKLSAAIDKLEAKANEAMEDSAQRPSGPKMAIRKMTIGGVEVHHMALFIVTPSWAIKDGRFYFSLMPPAIPAAIEAAKAKSSILDNPGFIALRKRLAVEKPLAIDFVDLPKTAPDGYTFLTMAASMVESFTGSETAASLLPPLNKLLLELAPAGGASWTDAAGWHYKSIAPLPGSVVLGGQQSTMLASPALMAAILMPSLGRARELSNRGYDAASLRGIAQSCMIYSADHSDKLPDHLAELVALNMISPKQLVMKDSGTQPAALTLEQMEAAKKDWHAIEAIIDEHCDVIYLGKGTKNELDATMVLVFHKPWLARTPDGICVAFRDVHAEFVRRPNLVETFAATEKDRKAAGLPAVDIQKMLNGEPPATTMPAHP